MAELIGQTIPVRRDLWLVEASDLGQTWQSARLPHGLNPVCALARLGLLDLVMLGIFARISMSLRFEARW